MTAAQEKELQEILNSEAFNQIFDIESEQKEIETSGWTYSMIQNFANSIK